MPEVSSVPVTASFRGFTVIVTLPKDVKSTKPAEELMNRYDATLKIYDSVGSLLAAADQFGFLSRDAHYPAIASPLTNLQRFLLKHGR